MKCLIVIPARMASTRFPGKPLVDLLGKPMIQWVVEAALASGVGDAVVVATPDAEIMDACRTFGADAVLTRDDHASGTDRIGEVAETIVADVYVNVQGDEPLLPPESIRACATPLLEDSTVAMGSLFAVCEAEDIDNTAVVKVVTDRKGFALYFSRHAIPFARNARPTAVKRHVGVYAYRREAVQAFTGWPVGDLEAAESLEQLRFLENGVRILMSEGRGTEMGVDTPEQAESVRKILGAR
ncbi:MAG: 3-deoxy-manno-octulosonate cytidylyltransferase [Armatimonadetes bacterium]|nr:3-deoxy-manno-octulosonate cytidylyltransferase [Armatimonadota bacterium]